MHIAGHTVVVSKTALDITVDHKLNASQESSAFGEKGILEYIKKNATLIVWSL